MPAPPQNGDPKSAITQIAIELYAPLPGGLASGGRFAPSSVKVPGLIEVPLSPETRRVDWPFDDDESIGFWGRVAAGKAAGSLLAVLVFTGATWQTPWREILDATTSTFVYAFCCSSLGFLTLPRVAPGFSRRLAASLRWGRYRSRPRRVRGCRQLHRRAAQDGARIHVGRSSAGGMGIVTQTSIYFTLIFGIFFTVTGGLRARPERVDTGAAHKGTR